MSYTPKQAKKVERLFEISGVKEMVGTAIEYQLREYGKMLELMFPDEMIQTTKDRVIQSTQTLYIEQYYTDFSEKEIDKLIELFSNNLLLLKLTRFGLKTQQELTPQIQQNIMVIVLEELNKLDI